MKNFPFEGSIPSSIEKPNSLKSGHLKEGAKSIMACVGTPEDLGDDFFLLLNGSNKVDSPKIHNVSFSENFSDLIRKNYKTGGNYTYVISTIDSSDKFSKWLANCTGMVITGKDKETGENISFLSHQYSKYLVDTEKRNRYEKDLEERLRELKERSIEGTMDAVLFGGNYMKNNPESQNNYRESINLLSGIIEKNLNFEPVVITGPKIIEGNDNVYYANKDRKFYILKPEVGNNSVQSFLPSEIKEQEKKWSD